MKKIVLDANTCIDWFIPSQEGENYSRHLQSRVFSDNIRFVVPLHFDIEVAGHLVKKSRHLPEQFTRQWLTASLEVLDALPIDITALGINFELLGKLAIAYNLSPYDVPYLQLARILAIPIATRDRGVVSACHQWHVEHWQP